MELLKSLLEPGTIVGIIGVLIGVWGLWVGYKGRRIQLLEYQVSSTQIITNRTNNIPGLKIVVGDEFASDLISSKIEFFNHGNATIMQKDFGSTAPLQIITSGHFFNADTISKELIKSGHSSLNPSLKISGTKMLIISFEYLKPKQSFSMNVLHDGDISIGGDLISGKIQPVQKVYEEKNRFVKRVFKELRESSLFDPLLPAVLGAVAIIAIFLGGIYNADITSQPEDNQLIQQIEYLQTQNEELMETVDALHESVLILQNDIEHFSASPEE